MERKGVSHKIKDEKATTELLKKIRKIEIKARGLSDNVFSGQYHSAFKGKGMSFAEVRQYNFGDDVRNIDWNVTARYNDTFVKTYEEERELTVMIVMDVSGSEFTGLNIQKKSEYATEIAAMMAFSAIKNNDKVGLILFSSKIELFIPPKKGRTHTLRLIREMLTYQPEEKGTDITLAYQYLYNVIKRKCTTFIISDFKADNYADALKQVKKRHDLINIKVQSQIDKELPKGGLIHAIDPETGIKTWIDTSDKKIREVYQNIQKTQEEYFTRANSKSGVDSIELMVGENYISKIRGFFKKRGQLK